MKYQIRIEGENEKDLERLKEKIEDCKEYEDAKSAMLISQVEELE